jgi:hypothetical protein
VAEHRPRVESLDSRIGAFLDPPCISRYPRPAVVAQRSRLHPQTGRCSCKLPKPMRQAHSPTSHKTHHGIAPLQSGADISVIALWLGHESVETTHVYVEADMPTKERALQKLAPAGACVRKFTLGYALIRVGLCEVAAVAERWRVRGRASQRQSLRRHGQDDLRPPPASTRRSPRRKG